MFFLLDLLHQLDNMIKIYTHLNLTSFKKPTYYLLISYLLILGYILLDFVMHYPIRTFTLWPKIKVVTKAYFIIIYSGKNVYPKLWSLFSFFKKKFFHRFISLSLCFELICRKRDRRTKSTESYNYVYQLKSLNYLLSQSIYSLKG